MGRPDDAEQLLERLGTNVRVARAAARMTQERVGLEGGIHRTHVSQIENGQLNVAVLNLVQLARTLGTTASELLRGVE
jgi:transcriptional regulator with XRE-family HTH domain